MSPRRLAPAVALLLAAPAPAQHVAVPRAECFPVERLPPGLRPRAEALLWKLLDSEGLYTLVGNVKPLSDGFWQGSFPEADATSPEADEVRRALAAFACGPEYAAGVHVFVRAFDGKRSATAFVAHRASVRETLARHAAVFAPLGLWPAAEPAEVLARVDRADDAGRWRAFGLLFGYPEPAVDFFVAAGLEQRRTGRFVERDFVRLPTFGTDRGRFVYAVPKGHRGDSFDRVLRGRVTPVSDEYARRRPRHAGGSAAGLLRDWYDNGGGYCHPLFARAAPPARPEPVLRAPCAD